MNKENFSEKIKHTIEMLNIRKSLLLLKKSINKNKKINLKNKERKKIEINFLSKLNQFIKKKYSFNKKNIK